MGVYVLPVFCEFVVAVFGVDEAFFEEAAEFFVDFFFGLSGFFGDFVQG